MRFLQASDFHLSPERPERLEALREVARRAADAAVDAMLIPGDLFDDPGAAVALRVEVRDALEAFRGPTLIIPGNHDLTAFPREADYGRRTRVLDDLPYSDVTQAGAGGEAIRVIGVPFRHGGTLGRDLAGLECDPLRTILLAHGTYQTEWVAQLSGEGDEKNAYYPIRRQDLEGRFAYAALGHVHRRATFERWSSEGAWGYAGSPVAISRSELGRRHAVIVELEPGRGVLEVEHVALETPYWEEIRESTSLSVGFDSTLARLRAELARYAASPDALRGLLVRVDGWIDGAEADVRDALIAETRAIEAGQRVVELDSTLRSAGDLIESHAWLPDLLERTERLAPTGETATAARATALLIEAVAGVRR